MLGESFRRQLLMDGQYGSLVFVATQSDGAPPPPTTRFVQCFGLFVYTLPFTSVLVPSEIAANLGLSRADNTVAQLAEARNAFTRGRIEKDFIDGLVESASLTPPHRPPIPLRRHFKSASHRIASHGIAPRPVLTRRVSSFPSLAVAVAGGETNVDRASLAAKFKLPVFCISSMDYQKLTKARTRDGPPEVWQDIEQTELPSLQRFVHSATLQRRAATIRKHVEALVSFTDGVETYLFDDGTASEKARARAKEAFEKVAGSLAAALAKPQAAFAASLQAQLQTAIVPQCVPRFSLASSRRPPPPFAEPLTPRGVRRRLKAGAGEATKECSATARKWRTAGMHWATFKATCRRFGEWKVNLNEEARFNRRF